MLVSQTKPVCECGGLSVYGPRRLIFTAYRVGNPTSESHEENLTVNGITKSNGCLSHGTGSCQPIWHKIEKTTGSQI